MEITLEKIELVKDRTGATYAEAKAALEAADGSVVDAIIAIEESINSDFESGAAGIKDSKLVEKVKAVIAKGNMSRIIIKKDGDSVLNLPITAGVVGAVLVPWGAILGTIAAVGMGCAIEFVNDKGDVVDLNGKVIGAYDKAADFSNNAKEKFEELNIKEKIDDFNIKEKIDELKLKENFEDLKKQAGNIFKKTASDSNDEGIQFGEHINIDVEDIEEAEKIDE